MPLTNSVCEEKMHSQHRRKSFHAMFKKKQTSFSVPLSVMKLSWNIWTLDTGFCIETCRFTFTDVGRQRQRQFSRCGLLLIQEGVWQCGLSATYLVHLPLGITMFFTQYLNPMLHILAMFTISLGNYNY